MIAIRWREVYKKATTVRLKHWLALGPAMLVLDGLYVTSEPFAIFL